MGGWEEEVFFSMYRAADAMEKLGEPWPLVQDAYLRAWNCRPIRAEPLYAIARRYRVNGQYWLDHLFAERAAQIPLPMHDKLFVAVEIYEWRALDEQAVCASWIGKSPESFAICRRLLARADIPDEDRRRIAANRDRIGRFLVFDAGLSDADRLALLEQYQFLEFVPAAAHGPALFDTARFDACSGSRSDNETSPRTATLDEALCLSAR